MKRRVLIIEDEQILAEMVQYVLEEKGFEVRKVLRGQEAMVLLDSFRPEALVLDLMLPDMNGLDILEKVRQEPATRNLPVIVITTVKSRAAMEKAHQLGILAYLLKPFDSENLVSLLKRALP